MAETRGERPVFAAARRQHGVVTTTQLLAAGWDKDVIARRVASGYFREGVRASVCEVGVTVFMVSRGICLGSGS